MAGRTYIQLPVKPHNRWQVIFEEPANADGHGHGFQLGLYTPEFPTPNSVNQLEMHSGPEVFCLQSGNMGLIIRDTDGAAESEIILELETGRAVVVFGYHNGFTSDGGVCLVAEAMGLETKFLAR